MNVLFRIELTDAPTRSDPTGTSRLRARMRAEGDRRWQVLGQTLRKALIEHDLVGLRGMSSLPHGDKTEGFALWLREELRQKVLGLDGRWLKPYVQQAAGMAQTRAAVLIAMRDANPNHDPKTGEFASGSGGGAREKFLNEFGPRYLHGTLRENVPAIKSHGLSPMAGEFVEQAYGGEYKGAGIDLPKLVYLASETDRERAFNAIRAHVAIKLDKDYHDVTYGDVKKHGALIVARSTDVHEMGEDQYSRSVAGEKFNEYEEARTAESGDWYSFEPVSATGVLTGARLVSFMKKHAEVKMKDAAILDPARVTTMENLAVSELRGITEVALQQLTRCITHCLMAGSSPTRTANAASGVIRNMRMRTQAMAEYIVSKTHATSTLSAFRNAGVTHVGTIPERLRKRKMFDYDPDEPREHGRWTSGGGLSDAPMRSQSADVLVNNQHVEVLINPTERSLLSLAKDDPEQALRHIEDEHGNQFLWKASQAIHGQMQKALRLAGATGLSERTITGGKEWYLAQRVAPVLRDYLKQGRAAAKSAGYYGDALDRDVDLEEVEVLTAGDDDVCYICEDISDGGPYDLDEAEDLIPAHIKCRCGFVPASDARFASVHDDALLDFNPYHEPAGSSEGGHFASAGWGGEPLKGSSGDPALISTALTTAKPRAKAEREAVAEESYNYQQINLDQVKKDPELFEGSVDTFRNPELFPYMRASDFNGDPEHDSRSVIDRIKSNLHVLWDDTKQESKDLWRHWYVGAHDLISERMAQYKSVGRPAMTAVYAALSPNTQWDVNVHLGDRLLDTVFNHASDKWDKKMADAAQGQLERAEKTAAKAKNMERAQDNLDKMKQTFRETQRAGSYDKQKDDLHRAAWVKLWNDAHDDTPVREVGINGKLGNALKNKGLDDNGEPTDMSGAFGPLPRLANAIRALRSDGNVKEISDALGDRHKVRSFYNNILDPRSANNDVTIDTHAAGGAWLDPLGGKSSVLGQMFGSAGKAGVPGAPKSNRLGVAGTYPFYADAYREVAKEVGLDNARELQSIIWEHKIALFKGAPDAKKELIHQVWEHFNTHPEMTLEKAQQRVMRIAKAGYNAVERRKRTKDEAGPGNQFYEEEEYPSNEG